MKSAAELRILMISLDPVLLGQGSGDVLQRHMDYASRVRSLDIIVLGGTKSESKKVSEKLTIHSTGGTGIMKAFRAYSLGSDLCRRGVDLIDTQDPHLTGLIGWLLKRKFQIPLEVHCHGDFIDNSYWRSESWKNYWYEKLQTFIFKRVNGIRVVSPLIADKIVEHKLSAAPVAVINTPVDTERFSQQLAQPDPQYFTIVSNIRLVPAKNIPFTLEIIKALAEKYPTVRYRIIGSGPLRATLEQKVKDLDLLSIVDFRGSLTPEQVVHEYAQADLMLLLSTNESFGKVIIEAGLMGVPTVASRTGTFEEAITDGTDGFVAGTDEEWYQKLKTLVTNIELRQQMSRAARTTTLARYTTENGSSPEYYTFLQNIIKS
jgi:glycosyltransferase involved in cell wall biosynthesis